MTQIIFWKPLYDGIPSPIDHPRVLVYAEGFDRGCPQIFDVETSLLCAEPTSPDDVDNPAFGATHWAPLPIPVDTNATFQPVRAA